MPAQVSSATASGLGTGIRLGQIRSGVAWTAPARRIGVPGVGLPLTGPDLVGLRARVGASGELEMLIGNPGGGRGIYVGSWEAIRLQATPSLHDSRLLELLQPGAGAPLTPDRVRAAALEAAGEGFCGRRAAQVARTAQAAERTNLLRLRSHLLLETACALDLPGARMTRFDPWTAGLEEQAIWLGGAPEAIAARIGMQAGRLDGLAAAELSASATALATVALPLGFGPAGDRFRLPRILQLMARAGSVGQGAVAACILARHTLACDALRQARAAFDKPLALLADWRHDPDAVTQLLMQPSWLLDGWDRLCLVRADPAFGAAGRRAVAQLLTQDISSRMAVTQPSAATDASEAGRPADRSGSALAMDRTCRNERLRLAELRLDDPDDSPPASADDLPGTPAGVPR